MLLLDKNTRPENTVYYLSGVIHCILRKNAGINSSQLYNLLIITIQKKVNYDFYILALDFLFLIDRLNFDDLGGLHIVH